MYKDSCQIDTNTVHNVTVCVDFDKKDTFVGTSFVENLPKKTAVCFLTREYVKQNEYFLETMANSLTHSLTRSIYHSDVNFICISKQSLTL